MALPKLLFKAPVLTASGYGVHSRQLLRALLVSGKYDVSVSSVRWGETPFLFDDDLFLNTVRGLAEKYERERASAKYDVSVQVTIPNEFERLAAVNVGVTAGIEVDRASPAWLSKANETVDLVIVPSQHSAQTFAGISYQNESGEVLRLQKPTVVVPEGVDTSVFNTAPAEPSPVDPLEGMPAANFLCVGLGLNREDGEDRKNVSTLVRWFCERFKDDPDVGLVLKVSIVNNSLMDFETLKARVSRIKQRTGAGEFPRIRLVHGKLSDVEMAALYRHGKVLALVSLTHGEGFGLPLLEAAACGLPVVATGWSGHLDFLSVDGQPRFVSLDHSMTEVPREASWPGVIEPGTRWASPDEADTKRKLTKLIMSPDVPRRWAAELAERVASTHSLEATGARFVAVIDEFLGRNGAARPRSEDELIAAVREKLSIQSGGKDIIYTMPMSAGDVFVSTAVISGLRKKHPEHRIFFATDPKYFSLLTGNPDVAAVIGYEPWMQNVPLLERIFDVVCTPNLAVQLTTSNWVKGGKGRLLAHELAHHCDVELGEYHVERKDPGVRLPERYVCFNPGPMKGQWAARSYLRWQEVIDNVRELSGLPVVQVGQADDPSFEGVVDLRGRTKDYNELAHVIGRSSCMVGIDTATMHIAAGLSVPVVSVFGSSYSTSTGPVGDGMKVLLDSPTRGGCEKACYKDACRVDPDRPCVNEVEPRRVVSGVLETLAKSGAISPWVHIDMDMRYRERRPKVAGYTTTFDCERRGYPYVQSIMSMLGFCDEVVVVDGGSTDGTLKRLRKLAADDSRLRIVEHPWDWEEPAMDGMQKAYARAMVTVGPSDFCWQQDADEVVHEDDYPKIRQLLERFPRDVDVLHLPVVELWGDARTVRTDRHSWKWRLSRNSFRVTHGVNAAARVLDERTGKVFAKKGQSDGCEYVDVLSHEPLSHRGFYTRELEALRLSDPVAYGREMNRIFGELPSVFHYSWADIPLKVRNFKRFWDRCWSNLHGESEPSDRFPGVETEEQVLAEAARLRERGGEHGPAQTFRLERSGPKLMDA